LVAVPLLAAVCACKQAQASRESVALFACPAALAPHLVPSLSLLLLLRSLVVSLLPQAQLIQCLVLSTCRPVRLTAQVMSPFCPGTANSRQVWSQLRLALPQLRLLETLLCERVPP